MLFLAQKGFRSSRTTVAAMAGRVSVVGNDRTASRRSCRRDRALDLKDATLVGHSTGAAKWRAKSAATGRSESRRQSSWPPCRRSCSRRRPIQRACRWRYSTRCGRDHEGPLTILQGPGETFYGANRSVPRSPRARWIVLALEHAGRSQERPRHQGLLRDRFHRGPQKIDVPTWSCTGRTTDRSREDSAKKSARLIRGAKEIYYPGAPHGLTATHQDGSTQTCWRSSGASLRRRDSPVIDKEGTP